MFNGSELVGVGVCVPVVVGVGVSVFVGVGVGVSVPVGVGVDVGHVTDKQMSSIVVK
jgi:hypothetical protein